MTIIEIQDAIIKAQSEQIELFKNWLKELGKL